MRPNHHTHRHPNTTPAHLGGTAECQSRSLEFEHAFEGSELQAARPSRPRGRAGAVPAPPPIFRSRLQGELLARLLLGPEREISMLDLAVMLRSDLASVMREVERLARADVLPLRRTLAGRMVARNAESPLYEPLARLLMLTFGPAVVVADEFGRLSAVRELYLFGPWAERYEGIPGTPPVDVEVLVIGELPPEAAFDTAQEAAARLGLPVHAVVRSLVQWRDDTLAQGLAARSGSCFA